MTLTTNGMEVDDLGDAPNGPALALNLGNQVDAFYGGSVANFAALPASGEFTGQRIYLEDPDTFAVWTATAWKVPAQAGNDSITIAVAGTAVSKVIAFPIPYPVGVVPVVSVVAAASSLPHERMASLQAGTVTNTQFTAWGRNSGGTTAVSLVWNALG